MKDCIMDFIGREKSDTALLNSIIAINFKLIVKVANRK